MNYFKKNALLLCLLIAHSLHTKMVESIEDPYLAQATQEIITVANEAAQSLEFTKDYEIAIPKKAGMQINPWNKLIACSASNPRTKLPFIIVNPALFVSLGKDEQTFLLTRCFVTFNEGIVPISMKTTPYLAAIVSWLLAFLFFRLLGKTFLSSQRMWVRGVIAFFLTLSVNFAFMNSLQTKLLQYFGKRHDIAIIEKTIALTKNRDAAIKALQALDAIVKNEIKNGEQFFAPYVTLFEDYSKEVSRF